MERKVEVYKDSNGKLHEKREEYLIAELDIIHKSQIETWKFFLERVKSDPTEHFKILSSLASKVDTQTKEEREASLKEHLNFIKEAKKAVLSKECGISMGEPRVTENWNESPGTWLGISAQDLNIPNC